MKTLLMAQSIESNNFDYYKLVESTEMPFVIGSIWFFRHIYLVQAYKFYGQHIEQ